MIQATLIRSISTVIIAQNEEECIANAIQSCLPFADEIVVVDGGSQDATVQISESLGCKVYTNPWPGYSKQRNFGADQAKHDWIFFLDADEVVDTELAIAISAWKTGLEPTTKALSVKRVGDFFGKWLDSRAEAHVRLYDKTQCRIKDVLVHEGPDVKDDPVTLLPGTLWHQGFRDMSDLVIRFNKYTDLDANQAHLLGKKFSLIRLLLKPPAKFLQQYLWYGMYRQGLAGFTLASLWSYYIFLKEIKLYEIDWRAKGDTQPEPKEFGLSVTPTHQVQA
ncbi:MULTISPECIES: glycosyltransferase family 2 protein [unclassified Trichocoleus]|uniref:glycosyltransferase family 2 protein n=1 Tax=unclassified Trichocoleus TaxID=2628910 RepID=UPI0018EF5E8C|nr:MULTISPECIES: glycosyltransferase family 2 protein [unclassified Trichocoleus]